MRIWFQLPLVLLLSAAGPVLSQQPATQPVFDFPLDCILGETCWTARYNDRLQGKGFQDYMCGSRSQNIHYGTDFAIRDLGVMEKGVAVLAVASGKVLGVRNSEPDISSREQDPAVLKGKECGNGIMLNHGGGWTTQYCHLKKDSILVTPGTVVKKGQILGEVGLSGATEYPHLHFTVRHKKVRVDPFDGKPIKMPCADNVGSAGTLWSEPIAYEELALVYVSLSENISNRENRWQPQSTTLSANAKTLLVTGRVFGSKKGDVWAMKITRPDGSVFFSKEHTQDRDRQFQLTYSGKKRPAGGFQKGLWSGEVTVTRTHAGGSQTTQFQSTNLLVE